jgi:EAL domain-containing protein (putative c-di-GMP-specific phosphodiesterase class I)
VARLGGDEFTILLEDIETPEGASDVAGRVQAAVSQPFTLGGHEVFTTASIGIALGRAGYDIAEDILRDADTAMYRAKVLGKKRHVVFDRGMHDRAVKLLQLETDLRRALERKELFLHYQPIIALETGRVSGFEALARWQHPTRGLISPAEFIPVAEETGIIVPLGLWVLEAACRQMREWADMSGDFDGVTVSVNLSGRQFSQSDLVEQVSAALGKAGLAPARLKLEVTESMVMENVETVVEVLTKLRALGVGLSIDDFGTGYSSLSYLHKFPIDTLKIDRSFVGRMTDNVENAEIVRTIITLAKSLQMSVVAEGVETREQFKRLRESGCDFGQGFILSRPVAHPEAVKLVRQDFHQVIAQRGAEERALAA